MPAKQLVRVQAEAALGMKEQERKKLHLFVYCIRLHLFLSPFWMGGWMK